MTTKTREHIPYLLKGALLAGLLVLTACHDGDSDHDKQDEKPQADNPTVEGPVTAGGGDDCCRASFAGIDIDFRDRGFTPGRPFYSGPLLDYEDVGYRETEYFISGTAQSYIATDTLESDGIWNVEPAEGELYKSRIVVVRPIDDADFNGTVVVEWFNVTGGLDAPPTFLLTHTELTREGYVWVGVSAQSVGIEGGGVFDVPLKAFDEERYGSLSHPGDSFSYDIFSQAAQAVRSPVGIDPLEGLEVEHMIATGQSQSAGRMVTYYNAVHPTIDLFDGFLVVGWASGSYAISQAPQAEVPTPDTVYFRDDLSEPVIKFQTETDVLGLSTLSVRQKDSDYFRLWEVAGTAHSDNYNTKKSFWDLGNDPTVADVELVSSPQPPFINCDLPVNDGPGHWVAKAATAALNKWVTTGDAPRSARHLKLKPNNTEFALDEFGNVLGGIRTPYVDTPVATLSGLGNSDRFGLCRLYGTTELFDEATLANLYPNKTSYIIAIDKSTDEAVAAGFILPADAKLIKDRARESDIGNP